MSATKTPALSIFLKIVSTIGGLPPTPFVSRSSSRLSRITDSTTASDLSVPSARSNARSIKFLPLIVGVSSCQEKKTVSATVTPSSTVTNARHWHKHAGQVRIHLDQYRRLNRLEHTAIGCS